ncbi:MAG: hypothetical protein RI940_1708 [Bacteroidota bacterium]
MLPESFLKSLAGLPGFDRQNFEQAHEIQEQVTSVRINSAKPFDIHEHAFLNNVQQIPWCKEGSYLNARPIFAADPLWHAGAYYVQDASSMFIQHILNHIVPAPPEKIVLDLCAAPGGKSTLLANYFRKGLVVANETIKSRNAILVENITKWGSDHVIVTQNDPAHFKALPQFFDVMLIDAPCSGSGLFRKDPDAINEWSEDSVKHCSTRQERIIEDSIVTLKEAGYLIYATCSYSFEEDEKIMDHICSMAGMQNVPIPTPSDWQIIETESPQHKAKGYRFYPDKIKGEGFFVAVFQKISENNGGYYAADFSWNDISKKEMDVLLGHFELPLNYAFILHQQMIIAIDRLFEIQVKALLKNLYIKKIGLAIGEIKGLDLIPSHALAVSDWAVIPYESIPVDLDTALSYLRRADLVIPGKKGWNTLSYMGIRLGWAKLLPNRLNNYYPNEWRLLKY